MDDDTIQYNIDYGHYHHHLHLHHHHLKSAYLPTHPCGKSQRWLQTLSSSGITVCAITSLFASANTYLCEGKFQHWLHSSSRHWAFASFTDGQTHCVTCTHCQVSLSLSQGCSRVKDMGGLSARWHLAGIELIPDGFKDIIQKLWPSISRLQHHESSFRNNSSGNQRIAKYWTEGPHAKCLKVEVPPAMFISLKSISRIGHFTILQEISFDNFFISGISGSQLI